MYFRVVAAAAAKIPTKLDEAKTKCFHLTKKERAAPREDSEREIESKRWRVK